ECWPWKGARTTAGYGHGHRDSRHFYAHRAAFESEHGVGSAVGLVVRHSCDNPPCCNPGHLLGGTQKDNNDDMWSRGRARPARGDAAGRSKLTEVEVLEMRRLASGGVPIARIRDHWPNLKHTTISLAVTGRTWAHLSGAVTHLARALPPGPRPGRGVSLN